MGLTCWMMCLVLLRYAIESGFDERNAVLDMEKKQTKREIKSAETQSKIIEVGRKLFRQYGYQQVAIRDICQEAGVSNGTFYHFFKSKQDLVDRVFPYEKAILDQAEKKDVTMPLEIIQTYIDCYTDSYQRLGPDTMYLRVFKPYDNFVGNKSMYDRERPIYVYLQKHLLEARTKGFLKEECDILEICDEIIICGIGVLYWACTTRQTAEGYSQKLATLLKPLMTRYTLKVR